jgi:uncharacterized membrane protein
MKKAFAYVRDTTITGLLFLLPVVVILVLLTKAWTALTTVGTRVADVFGLKTIVGVGGTTIVTGLLLVALCMLCGLLMRYAFLKRLRRSADGFLSRYLPGYDSYKVIAEEKLQGRLKVAPYQSALIEQDGHWRPAFVVERSEDGRCVVFVPDVPETARGAVLIAGPDQVRIMPSVAANDLEASLRKAGKGLLAQVRTELR